MIFSLLALVAFMIGAAVLIRSVDTGTLVVGNLGFKQDTVAHSNGAGEAAITWLGARISGAALDTHAAAGEGYYATSYPLLDPMNRNASVTTRAVVDWDGNGCGSTSYASGSFSGGCLRPRALPAAANGNAAQYVIVRLCSNQLAFSDAANVCTQPLTGSSGGTPGRNSLGPSGGGRLTVAATSPYFRVITRVTGVRNTVTFTETLVHF